MAMSEYRSFRQYYWLGTAWEGLPNISANRKSRGQITQLTNQLLWCYIRQQVLPYKLIRVKT